MDDVGLRMKLKAVLYQGLVFREESFTGCGWKGKVIPTNPPPGWTQLQA